MAIFHCFLKIKRKKNPLYNFTVLIPTHLQASLTLKANATGRERGAGPALAPQHGARAHWITQDFYSPKVISKAQTA